LVRPNPADSSRSVTTAPFRVVQAGDSFRPSSSRRRLAPTADLTTPRTLRVTETQRRDGVQEVAFMSTSNADATTWAAVPAAAPITWKMLTTHHPVTLLMDLARPEGPDSLRLLLDEGLPDGDWTVRPVSARG